MRVAPSTLHGLRRVYFRSTAASAQSSSRLLSASEACTLPSGGRPRSPQRPHHAPDLRSCTCGRRLVLPEGHPQPRLPMPLLRAAGGGRVLAPGHRHERLAEAALRERDGAAAVWRTGGLCSHAPLHTPPPRAGCDHVQHRLWQADRHPRLRLQEGHRRHARVARDRRLQGPLRGARQARHLRPEGELRSPEIARDRPRSPEI